MGAPPKVPQISESFRTLPAHEFEQMPSRIQLLLRKAKAYQLNLIELTGGTNPAPGHITRELAFKADVSIAEMARQVRQYLKVPIEDQSTWPSDEVAVENWRHELHEVGVPVFKDAFRVEGYSGFCLYDEEFPIIYVNNSSAKTRQMFTLFHELAHILFHASGVDLLNDDFIDYLPDDTQKIEIICNHFAAEFLQSIEQRKLLKGGGHADSFIIAKAGVLNGTVVTMEEFQPHSTKIPNICQHFRIPCMLLEDFMEREAWEF